MGFQEERDMSLLGAKRTPTRGLIALAAVALLAACGKDPAVSQPPLVIRSGDVCAVCGMYITQQPGPRGEAYVEAESGPLKFDSTRDFFAYVTQPDVASRLDSAYVQDAARIDWSRPSSAAESFTDARKAYYVAWQPLSGGMGPTFASFARLADADAFVRAHGGAVLRFGQITSALVSSLGYRCPEPGSPFSQLAAQVHCVNVSGDASGPGSMSSGSSMR
jgi:copper chaperone NosL